MGQQHVSVDRLQPGIFIELELPWHRHPFLFNKFKIKHQDEIAVLRDIGLSSVRFDPARSDALPLPSPTRRPKSPQGSSPASPMAEEKQRRIERLRSRRERFQRCNRTFRRQVNSAKALMSDLKTRPGQAVKGATALVEEMVDVLSAESELMVHLMNDSGNETLYYHALNVAVLAMLLAKNLELDQQTMNIVGLGALLHDIGKERIPATVLHKRTPWTKAERDFVRQHPRYGVELVSKTSGFPPEVAAIIEQHHELADGSGYPYGLTADQISLPTKIVQVADAYDNLCNHRDPKQSKTPHQAMSFMMAYQSHQLDAHLIQVFIRSLGVYPPGSVVELSNEMVGIIIGVDKRDLLNPSVLLYDADVPKSEALVVDLFNEPDLSIVKELRPADLPPDVVSYLSPRTKVSYYFDGTGTNRKGGPSRPF